MKKVTLIMISLMSVLAISAQPPHHDREGRQHEGLHREGFHNREAPMPVGPSFIERLDLTDAQQEQIDQLKTDHQKQVGQIQNQLEIKMAELKAAIQTDDVNTKTVDQTIDQINKLRADLFGLQIKHMISVRALLDDDQKIKFDRHQDNIPRRPFGFR